MKIVDHRLYKDDGTTYPFFPSPNSGETLDPRYLVFHYTAGHDAEAAIKVLTDPESKVSAHVLVSREGEITQLVPFNQVAWHAGDSEWQGSKNLNQRSIGIELDNEGVLTQRDGTWYFRDKETPPDQVLVAKHWKQLVERGWKKFPERQLKAALELARLLVEYYSLVDILGHDQIHTEKLDPGPAFPMADFRRELFGREDAFDTSYEVPPEETRAVTTGLLQPPLDFSDLIERNTREFVGRGWLMDYVERFLRTSDSRYLAIWGEPGIGKTAAIAYLTTQRETSAHFFCDPANPHTLDALEFSRSLAYQLSASLPDYVAYMQAPDLESVAQVEASSAITPTTGVIIESLLNVNPDPQDAFTALVLDPLQGWIAGHSDLRPIVLVVDGLDKAARPDQPVDIPRLVLEQAQNLPNVVRWIVTTRQETGGRFQATIGLGGVQGEQDVKQFLQMKFTRPELTERLKRSGVDPSELVETAAARAGSNFLAANRLVAEISRQLAFDLGDIKPLTATELVEKASQQAFMESTVYEGQEIPAGLRPLAFSYPRSDQPEPLQAGDYPWLLEAYDDFLEDPQAGYFMITGEWGSGKTSLAYLIAHERRVDAEYYCNPDDPDSIDARQFTRSLAHQISRKRSEYAMQLAGDSGTQDDGNVEAAANYIESQYLGVAGQNSFRLFQTLILDPLWTLTAAETQAEPFILLLDNLDAAANSESDNIADLVAVSEPGFKLPPNLRWILTAEPTARMYDLPNRYMIKLPDHSLHIVMQQPLEEPGPDLGIYAQGDGPRQRFEEIMPGISASIASHPCQTLTAFIRRSGDPTPYLLLTAKGDQPAAPILQPAAEHGGLPNDAIGRIIQQSERFLLVELSGERPFRTTLPDGRPVGPVEIPSNGLSVCKYGAETGFTKGQVVDADPANFYIRPPEFAAPGDVGALVVREDNHAALGVITQINEKQIVCRTIANFLFGLEGYELVSEPLRFVRASQIAEELEAITDLVGGPDRLGFSHYVEAFVRLIQDTSPPLTIGVYGAWGSGKSFLLDKISERLDPVSIEHGPKRRPDESRLAAESQLQTEHRSWRARLRSALKRKPKPPPTDYLVVWFKAWDYNASDKLWAGLVERILSGFEREMGWLHQVRVSLLGNLRRQWRELRGKLFGYLLFVVVAVALTAIFFYLNWQTLAAVLGFSTVVALLLAVGKQVVEALSVPTSQRIIDLFSRPDYTAELGFMGRIRSDLEAFARHLPKHKSKVVVFIDDLDRCEPKKAVEVLEAIKLLLELERFIVFLALDARIITQAIEEHYGKVLKEAEITGYEYLDKIVQIPFSIPQPRPAELRGYLGSLLHMDEAKIPPLEGVQELSALGLSVSPQGFIAQAIPTAAEPDQLAETLLAATADDQPPQPVILESQRPTKKVDLERVQAEKFARDLLAPEGLTAGLAGADIPPADQVPGAEPGIPPGEPGDGKVETLQEVAYTISSVKFDEDEQRAFLDLYAHLDTNPRRIKRLVNIYRLVRQLIRSRQAQEPAEVSRTRPNLLDNPGHILGWLVLCEQWPYASHILLNNLEKSIKEKRDDADAIRGLLGRNLKDFYAADVEAFLQEAGDPQLKKLDLKYERLKSLIDTRLTDFTVRDLLRLRAYTVNFNPALSAEVQLTLARGGN